MQAVIYTQRVEVIESYQERRDCADQRIADFIYACGFLPLPVPNRKEFAKDIFLGIKPVGIVLTGGNSLCNYGGNAPERDAMDQILIELAIQNHVPVYGFCRGMQSILYYFGNELEEVSGHVAVRHFLTGELSGYEVNSYHNQACMKLKENCGLTVLAQSEDGAIEAVQHTLYPIIGTMWHPEREKQYAYHDLERVQTLFREREKIEEEVENAI